MGLREGLGGREVEEEPRSWHKPLAVITVIPIKLETGLKPNRAGIPYTLLLRIEAIGFPTFGLML